MARWLRNLLIPLLACLGAPAAQAQRSESAPAPSMSFCAMGDAPYVLFEDLLIRSQVQSLPQQADFLVHVGDIKRGASPCNETHYEAIANLLRRSSKPVFIIPGDNEWNDCVDPPQAWKFWVKRLLRLEEHWKLPFAVQRQEARVENFSFVDRGVVFVGINIVGGKVHDPQEWRLRHADDLQWVRQSAETLGRAARALVIFGHAAPTEHHEDLFQPLVDWAKHDGRPVLYVHGDGHVWKEERSWRADNLWKVQLDRGGLAPPVLVTVTASSKEPFVFDRRLE